MGEAGSFGHPPWYRPAGGQTSLGGLVESVSSELSPALEFQARVAYFGHDTTHPLDVRESGLTHRKDIAIHDISYASTASGRLDAFLLTPPGDYKYPAVLFVHPAPGDRHTFLDEAVELAQNGIGGLLINAPWSQLEIWGRTMGEPEHDLEEHVKTIKDLRRAIDLLSIHPNVDAERITYVGHSFGALFGGILAGVDKRIKSFVLMSGVGSFADIAVLNAPQLNGPALDRYRQVLAPIDPIRYVRSAAPAPLLFQFGLADRTFEHHKFVDFAAAGSEPKIVKWYAADHYLPDQNARRDRLEWLGTELRLGKRTRRL